MEHGPTIRSMRLSSVKMSLWMSWRDRVTNSAWASLLGVAARRAAGEGRGLVSTTLMSEVFCMGSREEARNGAGRKGFWSRAPPDPGIWAKKWRAAYP